MSAGSYQCNKNLKPQKCAAPTPATPASVTAASPSAAKDSSSGTLPAWIIGTIIAGVVAFIVILMVLVYFIFYRPRHCTPVETCSPVEILALLTLCLSASVSLSLCVSLCLSLSFCLSVSFLPRLYIPISFPQSSSLSGSAHSIQLDTQATPLMRRKTIGIFSVPTALLESIRKPLSLAGLTAEVTITILT